uniref:Uncharacterized protein LOC111134132 isoform X3 n=1 Tax=Crassostrea virginica TaxID=6565 RepID=A0A8B8EEZ0_CRAVI|nr:uncharacterized protein LOC111134132 isoform X3 [Crassostrea virginica]
MVTKLRQFFGFVYHKNEKTAQEGLLTDVKVVGVARKKTVSKGVHLLLKENVHSICIIGQYGNSVFSTSSFILKKFANWKNWKAQQFLFTDVPDCVEEKTVMKVYGWFGTWNDDLCSLDTVKMVCQKLENVLDDVSDVKLVIEMSSDKYHKYRMELEPFRKLFMNEISLDGCYADEENLQHFKKIQRSCKHKKCPCKRLTFDMLHHGNDRYVGMPLKINIIAKHHDRTLIRNYIENQDILRVMTEHFTALETKENMKEVYEWISYICLKGQFSTSEALDQDLMATWDFGIQKDDFVKNDNLKDFFQLKPSNMETGDLSVYAFWHPFIYICAFHSLFQKDEIRVVESCNIDAIVELVRPEGSNKSYIEVSANAECANRFSERLRRLNLVDKYNAHPLFQCNHIS